MNLKKLIVKFLGRIATHKELEKLNFRLNDEEDFRVFKKFVLTDYIVSNLMASYDVENAKKSIQKRLKQNRRKRRLLVFKKISIAASVILLLGVFFHYAKKNLETQTPFSTDVNVVNDFVVSGQDKAVLILDNGDEVLLAENEMFNNDNAKSDGKELVYNRNNNDGVDKYNYLSTPRGGQFTLKLSDGTKVWLNAETKIKYPVNFTKGKTRKVELVYGEAYFDVSPSFKNNGSVFKVVSPYQKIVVLGTEFNVKAYLGDSSTETTLVEGKVKVFTATNSINLMPNKQSSVLNKDPGNITVKAVDASKAVSWKSGMFSFQDEKLEAIMKELTRWYDVDVFFEKGAQKNLIFTAELSRTETIHKILNVIETASDGSVKFEINKKRIYIR